jgi:hypothetical protein
MKKVIISLNEYKIFFYKFILVMLGMAILLVSSWALAVPPELRQQIHETKALLINYENRDVIWDLRPNKNPNRADYIILELSYDSLESEMVDILREWVRSGKGAIVSTLYSSEVFFTDEQLKTKSTRSRDSRATLRISPNTRHPIIYSVKNIRISTALCHGTRCQVNANVIIRQDTSDFIPLLETSNGEIWIAAINYGAGRIMVFPTYLSNLPCISTNKKLDWYDNERFAINLDQWLAGYPVPGTSSSIVAESKYANVTESHDMLKLKNGDTLSGRVLTSSFTLKTSYATLSFKVEEISQITIEGGGSNVDVVVLRIGDRLSGMLQEKIVRIKLPSGAQLNVERDKIKEISFAHRAEK